ncbi:MAG: hypothetical protein JWN83_2014 [Chitinophagaceae bacterium]|nr:hypothetical protein [Chitinophagaceae bacterium]
MPYYRITLQINRKKKTIGIRQLSNSDIDYAWRYYEKKAHEKYSPSDIIFFEVVMLSKLSQDVKGFLTKAKRPLINE